MGGEKEEKVVYSFDMKSGNEGTKSGGDWSWEGACRDMKEGRLYSLWPTKQPGSFFSSFSLVM